MSAGRVHPTAVVDGAARLGEGVEVGPYAVIGAGVEVGGDPQDKKFAGEHGELVIGDRNTIREFTTFSRGTGEGGGVTRIGDDNWIMAYVHIAHDCVVGNQTIFANNATLAGHAEVGDWAILGGFSGVHQFCKIGAHAFIGMGSLINADVPPFVMVAAQYAQPRGINAEGLKRRGFDAARIAAIKRAYRTVYMSGKPLADAKAELAEAARESDDVRAMLDFIEASQRGVLR